MENINPMMNGGKVVFKKTLKKGVVKHVEICFDWFKDTVSVLK